MCYVNIYFSIGEKIRLLLEREDGEYCFRLHKDRVYYSRLVKTCELEITSMEHGCQLY